MRLHILVIATISFLFISCNKKSGEINPVSDTVTETGNPEKITKKTGTKSIAEYLNKKDYSQYDVATFAGGCFWCTEAAFECIEGVEDVISGYTGGEEERPTYSEIGTRKTGHTESIQIYYNAEVISFETLLDIFFVAHDPTQVNRQGPDVGPQYRSAIFYHTKEQKNAVDVFFKAQTSKLSKPIATEVAAYSQFWVAEHYHQDYYWLNPSNAYVQSVSVPKVKKVEKAFKELLKKDCGK